MPSVRDQVLLAGLTTLGVGGPARRFVRAGTETELIAAVRDADQRAEPLLILGGGSNLVIADAGFPGTVVQVATRGIQQAAGPEADAVRLTVAAGEDWDGVVASCVAAGLSGLECLSGIPGLTGATPIQNVGAYGQEVAEVITTVRVYDRDHRRGDRTGRRGLRVRLPDQHVQAGQQRPAGRPGGDVPAAARRAVRAGPVRRAGPLPGRARGRPGPAGDGARGRAHAAPGQGHGARPGRPGQPQRGLVLHQPGAGRRAVRRAAEAGRRRTCRSRGSRPARARSRCPPRG